ncbi:MAG TPA: hypothetical protein VLA34_04615 [Candidatus Krumholzibacterium sp.]|nr:hypothetical protein [Candidatus Krumholzibacterium sp.]
MKTSRSGIARFSLMVGIVLLITGAIGVWALMDIPFGTLFDAMLHSAIAGFVLSFAALAYLAIDAKSPWWKVAAYPCALLALAVTVLTAVMHIDYRIIPGLSYRTELTSEEWIEDLRYLAGRFPEAHPDLFDMVDRGEYERFAADLERRIPGLDGKQVQMGLYSLLALPGDAHCYPNIFTHKLDWHSYPVQGYLFDSGLYILDAGRDHRRMIGTYLVGIDSTPLEEIYDRLRPYLAAESENNWKERFTQVVTVAEMLHAAGITKEPRKAVFTFKTLEGETFDVSMKAIHYMPSFYWSFIRKTGSDESYIQAPDRRDSYWFELRETDGTLYVQFNACVMEDVDETLDQFLARLDQFVQGNDFERCVVDVRKNGGGDPVVSRRLAGYMCGNPRVDREGRLFVLISRKTFSAGVEFATIMENNSRVIIIGEPTGQGPVFCGNPLPVVLPNSGIEMLIATNPVFSTLVDDGLDGVIPDIPARYTVEDHLAGRDPAMEAALAYQAPERAGSATETVNASRLTGRYAFSPFQLLTVSQADGRLRFDVTDFYEQSIMSAGSELYHAGDDLFSTDIRGVSIEFHGPPEGPSEGLTVHWRGVDRRIGRAGEDTVYPMEMLSKGMLREAAAGFLAHADLYRETFPGLERILNVKGYELIRSDRLEDALVVMSLNVDLFPSSSNAYDSLGEVFMEKGEVAQAISNYERSLELNPDNANAVTRLEKLRKM